jgi:hypothetical protein
MLKDLLYGVDMTFRKMSGHSDKIRLLCAGFVIMVFLSLTACGGTYETENIKDYGVYQGHIPAEEGGLFAQHSQLLVFPERIAEEFKVNKYYYRCSAFGIDNTYQLILDYQLPPDAFEDEIGRLGALSITYKGEVKYVKEDSENFPYPAYVTMFTKHGDYEYALIDESNCRIIAVLSTGDIIRSGVFEDYRPLRYSMQYEPYIDWYGFSIYQFPINSKQVGAVEMAPYQER